MRSIMDVDGAPWQDMGPHPAFDGPVRGCKRLHAPTGKQLLIFRFDGVAHAHLHLRPTSFFMTGGSMALRDRTVGPGMWGLEPTGAIHPATTFHDAVYGYGMTPGLDIGVGIVSLPPDGKVPPMLEKAGFAVDELDDLVDSAALDWTPSGVDGVAMKLLHPFEGSSAFSALYRAEAGARLPRRRYVGPTDQFVFEGQARFDDAEAGAGTWIHQPLGSTEGEVRFEIATEWLQNSYGPVLDLGADGAIQGITDGFSLTAQAGKRVQGAYVN